MYEPFVLPHLVIQSLWRYVLLINVLTELIRLINFALTLALSGPPPPKEGSFCVEPHPTTILRISICGGFLGLETV